MGTSPRQQAVLDAVRQWQKRLLQLDRRNALLYFPVGKRGVWLLGVDPDAFLEKLSSAREGLSFAYAERVRAVAPELFAEGVSEPASDPEIRVLPGDIETDLPLLDLQKRLVSLRERNREWQEEQGIAVLFLAFGFLHWTDEDQQPASSPVLLAPCDLARASPRDPFRLVRDESDDPVVNPTLRHKLANYAGIELPELGEETTTQYLDAVRRLIAHRQDWSVDTSVVLATFPFSKLAMWEDMERMAAGGVTHGLIRRLAGDGDAPIPPPFAGHRAVPPDGEKLKGAKLDDLLDVRDQFTVVDADFSQLRAIELARSGRNLVIHGPPGTGKSQTIANIIATQLAEGRRVLFVSEKTAALDVVKRRLADVGLGTFCLDLHSERGKKASVYAQLREAMEQRPTPTSAYPFGQLTARRDQLNAVVRALHERRLPLGVSVFEVHGRVAAIQEAPRIAVAVRDIATLDGERLRRIRDAAMRVARRVAEFREHFTSRWRALDVDAASPRLADLVRDDLARVRAATVSLRESARAAATSCGVPPPEMPSTAARLLPLLDHMSTAPGAVPSHWLDPATLERVEAVAAELRNQIDDRRRVLAVLHPFVGEAVPALDARESLEVARSVLADAARWERTAGSSWSRRLVTEAGVDGRFVALAGSLARVHDSAARLEDALGRSAPCDTLAAVEATLDLAERVLSIPPIPGAWNGIASLDRIRDAVRAAGNLARELTAAEDALAEGFDLDLVDRVDDEMLTRFRVDHRSLWRWFRSSYRADLRIVRGCLRRPHPLSLEAATTAVERTLAVKRLRFRWSEIAPDLEAALGDRFTDRNTDWDHVLTDVDLVASIYRDGATIVERLRGLLREKAARSLLAGRAGALRDDVTKLGATAKAAGTSAREAAGDALLRRKEDFEAFAAAVRRIAEVLAGLGPLLRRPEDLQGVVDLLQALVRLGAIEEDGASRDEARAHALGSRYDRWRTDVGALDSSVAWVRGLVTVAPSPIPSGLAASVCESRDPTTYRNSASRLRAAADRYGSDTAAVAGRFPASRTPWGGWADARFDAVLGWCDDLVSHADEATDWVEYRAAGASLDDEVGGPATVDIRGATDDAAVVPDAVLRHVYLSWLEHVHRGVTELRFAPRDLESVLADFRALDAKFPVAARERVREKCFAVHPHNRPTQVDMGESGVLHHELSKRKRHLPVRKLVARIPHLLQALKPCFMMSPLAVSQYLPRGDGESQTLVFDTVIFDEASQVFPEDAVPAISRGAQVVVVGDQKQLPPSSFFRRDDGTDGEEADDEDEEPPENRLVGVESILDVLVGMRDSGVEDAHLLVHYRSRHDDLIRFSNHHFYDDRLLTFPSAFAARPGLGVRSVYLSEGRFDAGASRTNRVEAERVVELVFELMETQPESESIGVVALSRPQADLIQELFDRRRLSDRRFDARFSEAAHERFFVKNLENVQGDERDHVILSIGYGPTTATGIVHNRFGPINVEGGQRRLNVAISRARRSMTVVHSLRPEDVRSETVGSRLLRRFLEFLRDGAASFEGAVTPNATGEAESPFEDAVGRALEARGHRIHRQVGCAKFAIDLAVRSEDDSGYDLGIECDGEAYHASPSARDRDRLRQDILERLGWRIHRVWSTAWIRNPKAELDRIERALWDARAFVAMRGTERSESIPNDRSARLNPSRAGPATQPAVAAQPFAFKPYVFADLQRFSRRTDLREERTLALATMVVAIVEAEAPIHEDLVIERIRLHYGLQRAGRNVRDAVDRGIRAALSRSRVLWLDPHASRNGRGAFLGCPGGDRVDPRGPAEDGYVRTIEQIAPAEIEDGILAALGAMYGGARSEVVLVTARAFGFARVGALVEEHIGTAIEQLLLRGEIVERMGALGLKT